MTKELINGANKTRHVTIIDFISIGHHGTWLKEFVKCLLDMGHRVTIFYPDKKNINVWIQSQLASYISAVDVYEIPEAPIHQNNRFTVLRRWMTAKKFIRKKKVNPDLVFFAWIDDFRFRKDHPLLDKFYLKWVEWFFPYKWSGLYFHPVHLRMTDSIHNSFPGYDIDDVFKLKNCTSVCILDREIQKKLEEKIHRPVIRFPDFTDDSIDKSSALAADLLDAAHNRKIILLAGALLKRKGILTFLEAAKQSMDKPWLFALAGNVFRNDFSENELQLIDDHVKHPRSNVWLYTDHIQEPDFNALVQACNVIYAAYFDFPHTSNMLNKSAIFQKPLIVARGFYMDEIVSKLKMGEVIDESNPQEAKDALKKILESENYITGESLKGFEVYRNENSLEKLKQGFDEVLQAAKIGAQPTPSLRTQ